jgi:hypothetical protein
MSTRRLGKGLILWLVGLIVLSFLGSSLALALWHASATVEQQPVGTGALSFGVQRHGEQVDHAPSVAAGVDLVLDSDDAGQLFAHPDEGIAIAFDVLARSDGHTGLTYSLDLEQPDPDTLFGISILAVFPVHDIQQCRPGSAPEDQPQLTDLPAIGTEYATVKTATHHWCLTAIIDPKQLEHYANTATASIEWGFFDDLYEDDATWQTRIAPDPAAQTDVTLSIVPQVIRPGD